MRDFKTASYVHEQLYTQMDIVEYLNLLRTPKHVLEFLKDHL